MNMCRRVVTRERRGSSRVCTLDTSRQYLIWFRNFREIPSDLRGGIRRTILDGFSQVNNLVFDFNRLTSARDLSVEYSTNVPIWGAWGESSRADVNGELQAGESIIFLGAMQAYRIATSDGGCVPAFENSDSSLGSMVANTTVHEIAHMLGLDTGGWDGGGHTEDSSNYLYAFRPTPSRPRRRTRMYNGILEYTVRSGDTMTGILNRFKRARLHRCIRGADGLTVQMIWETPQNQEHGYVAHPTKSDVGSRRANDPNWIYVGERVALPHHTFRSDAYRRNFPSWLGTKQFTDEQIRTMNDFVRRRIQSLPRSTP
jgi:hypothetical protein